MKGSKAGPIDQGDDEMCLFVWASGWGLPSIDLESLQIMSYVKFSGAPVKILECENPWKSPKGKLPFFKHGSNVLYSYSEIASYLRQKNYSCDFGLSPKESSEVTAYTQFVTATLDPALKYYCWVHESNYTSVIRPCYTKRMPWIYKFWYPDRRIRQEASQHIEAIYRIPGSESAEPDVLQKARECITVLSDKLASQEFFLYPNTPTGLDAVIFAYLASFAKIPLHDSPVKEAIRLTPNLERYVARILNRYYSKLKGPGGEALTSSSSHFGLDGHPTVIKSDEAAYPTHHKVLAVALGLGIMFAFAYYNGIVDFGFSKQSSSSIEEEVNEEDDENLIWE